MKTVLIYALWLLANPYDNGIIEKRALVEQSIDDWEQLTVNHGHYSGRMYWGGLDHTFYVWWVDPRVGRQLLKQKPVGSRYFPTETVLTRMWRTPNGYIFTLAERKEFFLDKFAK